MRGVEIIFGGVQGRGLFAGQGPSTAEKSECAQDLGFPLTQVP